MTPLTERQRQVGECLMRGLSAQETAQALRVAYGTVKCHRAMLYARLGVDSDVKAVLRLVREPELLAPPAAAPVVNIRRHRCR